MKKVSLLILLVLISIARMTLAESLLLIAPEIRIEPKRETTLKFEVSKDLFVRKPALSFLGRLDSEDLGGSTHTVNLFINGKKLTNQQMRNKSNDTEMFNGLKLSWFAFDSFRLVYSKDYEAANRSDNANCLDGGHAYDFVLDLEGYLKEGDNELRVVHTEPSIPNAVVLSQVCLVPSMKPLVLVSTVDSPAPQGEIPCIAPKKVSSVKYSIEGLPGGGFAVRVKDRKLIVKSSFSYPNAGWNVLGESRVAEEEKEWTPVVKDAGNKGRLSVVAKGKYYQLLRTLRSENDHITVSDKITNISGADLHVAFRFAMLIQSMKQPEVYLHGRRHRIPQGGEEGGANPTTFLRDKQIGFGMVAEDDVFRVQCQQYADDKVGEAGLHNGWFMIPAGQEYVIRWSLYPVPSGDYYDFVNAVRRNWGTNFTVVGPFAFAPHPRDLPKQIPDLKAWLTNGALQVVSLQIPNPEPLYLSHGLAFLEHPEEQQRLKAEADQLRAIKPGLKVIQYIDVYITSIDSACEKYKADRALDANGKQIFYPVSGWTGTYWSFIPTPENGYGQAMKGYFNLCLDELGLDGMYWDEMANSCARYVTHLSDGHSALVDNKTHTIVKPVAMIPLYCQSYQEQQAQRVLKAGKVLIANSQPETETMTRVHFPRFVEAWWPSNMLPDAQLYCPLGLGSPENLRSEDDLAAGIRSHFELGSLWYYYCGWNAVKLTHPTITEQMFPFTPIELHQGYLIGKERILTCRSGYFGWGDRSKHKVYVYDSKGHLKPDFPAPSRNVNGATYTELRLPGGWMAAIVRS